jgi:polyferredoxin
VSVALPTRALRRRFDVLRVPLLGSFLRWRYSRFVLQIPLLLIAILAVYDGVTGRQIAPVNTATVSVWVHYRGLVGIALAVFGNLFCAACPLMLTRGPSKWLKALLERVDFKPEWPKILRNKYLVLGLTVLFLFSYEHFSLWASPWLTAWLIIGYFAAALLTDAIFPAGTFCKYVCPLGNFNFALSGASPSQITARNQDVCSSCEGKYCLNGRAETPTSRAPLWGNRADHVLLELPMVSGAASSTPSGTISSANSISSLEGLKTRTFGAFPGCETDLFVPTIQSNTDCTLCLNCVRACPYDNVALEFRSPTREAEALRPKSDWALFVTVLAWAGLVNAFAMIPAFFNLAGWLSNALGTRNETVLLLIIQTVGIGGGVGLSVLAARASGALGGHGFSKLRDWAAVMLPLALAAWAGHYLYHFLTGYATLWPNIVNALFRLNIVLPPPPPPTVSRIDQAFVYQVVLSYLGLALGAWAAYRRTVKLKVNVTALAPQIVLIVLFVALTLLIFSQPMQARGSLLM